MRVRTGMAAGELGRIRWRKSRHSSPQGNCVEVAALPGGLVAVRDSRRPSGPALIFARSEWSAFTGAVRALSSAGATGAALSPALPGTGHCGR